MLAETLMRSSRHCGQSGEEEHEVKSGPQSPVSRRCSSGGVSGGKPGTQISVATPNNSGAELKSTSSASTIEVERPGTPEVKPSAEELLSAIHNLSTPGQNKTQLPIVINGETALGDGVPAFALHEKGLFYVPLTLDKSVVASYTNKYEAMSAPPLYPVTISVCFLLGPEKLGKVETAHKLELGNGDCEKAADLSQISHPIPLPLISASSASLLKSNRRGYHRDASNFLANRFCHQRQVPSKESNHHGRASGNFIILKCPYILGCSINCLLLYCLEF